MQVRNVILIVAIFALCSQAKGQNLYGVTAPQLTSDDGIELFRPVEDQFLRAAHSGYVTDETYLELDRKRLEVIEGTAPGVLEIVLPGPLNRRLVLTRAELISPNFRIRTSDGRSFGPGNVLCYQGIVEGMPGSIAAATIADGKIDVLLSGETTNYRIRKTQGSKYILYDDKNRQVLRPFECGTPDTPFDKRKDKQGIRKDRSVTGDCVELYVECDRQTYIDNGSSIANTEAWVDALFNEVAVIYLNEGIPVSLREIFIWTTSDPYAGLTGTSAILDAFDARMQNEGFNGTIAHLLSSRPLNGGIANIDEVCDNKPHCFSAGLNTSGVTPFPDYSWNVMVVAHEMGHVFGSRHTHACVWNGNTSQIDDCGNSVVQGTPEGAGCYTPGDPIIPADGGTIMSYCHLVSGVGISFTKGFGPQPGNLIYSRFANATCNTGSCGPPLCNELLSPQPGANGIDVNVSLSWSLAPGATGYFLSVGTTEGGSDIIDNADVGQVTEYQLDGLPFGEQIWTTITPYNLSGVAPGCAASSFTTAVYEEPGCSELLLPADGAVDVDPATTIYWSEAPGTPLGYVLSIGTTPGGSEVVDNEDVGAIRQYTPPTDFPSNTVLYVRIAPYGLSGPLTNCSELSFTTTVVNAEDICATAPLIACGAAVFGSTSGASYNAAPFCGTNNSTSGVWYRIVGTGTPITLSTCDMADFDTKINVYSGSCNALNCVAGVDDSPQTCANYSTELTFNSTAGTEYFILVHGYGNETGSFYLGVACEDEDYCGANSRNFYYMWISEVSLGEVTKQSGPSLYSDFTDTPIPVVPGGQYDIEVVPGYISINYNVVISVWLDRDSDSGFGSSGELLAQTGPLNSTAVLDVNVPANMPDQARMRIALHYNAATGSCADFTYGEVEDYLLAVQTCTVVTNTHSSGEGSLKYAAECASPGDTVYFSPSLVNGTIALDEVIHLTSDLCIMADPSWNIAIDAQGTERALQIETEAAVVIEGLHFIAGSAMSGSAISNSGSLLLKDVRMEVNPVFKGGLISNSGAVSFAGSCDIRNQ